MARYHHLTEDVGKKFFYLQNRGWDTDLSLEQFIASTNSEQKELAWKSAVICLLSEIRERLASINAGINYQTEALPDKISRAMARREVEELIELEKAKEKAAKAQEKAAAKQLAVEVARLLTPCAVYQVSNKAIDRLCKEGRVSEKF